MRETMSFYTTPLKPAVATPTASVALPTRSGSIAPGHHNTSGVQKTLQQTEAQASAQLRSITNRLFSMALLSPSIKMWRLQTLASEGLQLSDTLSQDPALQPLHRQAQATLEKIVTWTQHTLSDAGLTPDEAGSLLGLGQQQPGQGFGRAQPNNPRHNGAYQSALRKLEQAGYQTLLPRIRAALEQSARSSNNAERKNALQNARLELDALSAMAATGYQNQLSSLQTEAAYYSNLVTDRMHEETLRA